MSLLHWRCAEKRVWRIHGGAPGWLAVVPARGVHAGRDFYGMIENYPIRRAIPMISKARATARAIDWTFLGGSIANWSFVWFVVFGPPCCGCWCAGWRNR